MNYATSFQDNILPFEYNDRIKGILEWIRENRDKHDWAKDPNVYELVNIFLLGAKYSKEGISIDKDTLAKIWHIRSQDFANCNLSENSIAYRICEEAYISVMYEKPILNDENSHHALRKLAGICLYLAQQERDGLPPQYNNLSELLNLIKCSKSLRTFHPNLFRRFEFMSTISHICDLQFEHNLPDEIKTQIQASLQNLSKGNFLGHFRGGGKPKPYIEK